MKLLSRLLLLIPIGAVGCQLATAQPTPAVSQKYSNADLEKMIMAYKTSHQQDVPYPPQSLSAALNNDFPQARDIEWETATGIYEAEFEIGRTDYKAFYDTQANLLMYVLDIHRSDLPAIVANAIQTKYANSTIDDVKKITKGSEVFYCIEIDRNPHDIKVLFSENGTFVRQIFD